MVKGIKGVKRDAVLDKFRTVNKKLRIDRFIDINKGLEKSMFYRISGISFSKIFLFWIGMIFLFGLIYFLLSSYTTNYVLDKNNIPIQGDINNILDVRNFTIKGDFNGLMNSIYFSFVTATTVGYGDLTPAGITKIFAVFEAVLGLLVWGVVISKLVGIKQEAILEQLYEISYEESINELRSALYLFRIEANRIIEGAQLKGWSNEEILENFDVNLASLENALRNIKKFVLEPKKHDFLLSPDYPSTEILFEGISRSLKKMYELYILLESKNTGIRASKLQGRINSVLSLLKNICDICPTNGTTKTFSDEIDEIKKDIDKFNLLNK